MPAADPTRLIGKQFGCLTVTAFLGVKKENSIWQCQCKCGNVFPKTNRDLRKAPGAVNCVKCVKGPTSYLWKGFGLLPGTMWSRIVKQAEERGFKIGITGEEAWDKYLEQGGLCAMSGEKIVFGDRGQETTASLDRIDSARDYTRDNVQWVHKIANRMKMALPEDRFFEWCRKITEWREPNVPNEPEFPPL